MRNVRAFLDYVHMTTFNQINEKHPRIPSLLYVPSRTHFPNCHNQIPICTCVSRMFLLFNVWRRFCARLSVRVSKSGYYFNFGRKCCMKRNSIGVLTNTQARFTHHFKHHTLINTSRVQHRKKCLCQYLHDALPISETRTNRLSSGFRDRKSVV